MLYGVTALVRSYRCGCYVTAVIHILGQVNRLRGRVIMVRQLTLDTSDFHIVDTMVAQHLLRYVPSAHRQRLFAVPLELALERIGNQPTGQGDAEE